MDILNISQAFISFSDFDVSLTFTGHSILVVSFTTGANSKPPNVAQHDSSTATKVRRFWPKVLSSRISFTRHCFVMRRQVVLDESTTVDIGNNFEVPYVQDTGLVLFCPPPIFPVLEKERLPQRLL